MIQHVLGDHRHLPHGPRVDAQTGPDGHQHAEDARAPDEAVDVGAVGEGEDHRCRDHFDGSFSNGMEKT